MQRDKYNNNNNNDKRKQVLSSEEGYKEGHAHTQTKYSVRHY